jgi:transposase
VTFADYCASVDLLAGRRQTLLVTLEQTVPDCSHAPTIDRLRCFRGIETLTAAGLCAETSGFHRFPRPTLLSGFLGIVPSERTSDSKRRQGSITKAGSPHARRLLVEAAQHYRKQPAISQTHARRQDGQDPRVIEIAWRAQRRLHQRWQHLHYQRHKPAGVVAIAVARELAAFLWEAATPRCLTAGPTRSRPGRCRGAHEHPGRPSTVARGSRSYYGQPAPAGRARSQTASRDEYRVLR